MSTETTIPSIAERVAAGAAWLDSTAPGWLDRINLDRLELISECRCVLGQTFGNYYSAPLGIGLNGRSRDDAAARLGFLSEVYIPNDASDAVVDALTTEEDAEYKALHAEWRRLILARRAAA